jgi:hypothetical protein
MWFLGLESFPLLAQLDLIFSPVEMAILKNQTMKFTAKHFQLTAKHVSAMMPLECCVWLGAPLFPYQVMKLRPPVEGFFLFLLGAPPENRFWDATSNHLKCWMKNGEDIIPLHQAALAIVMTSMEQTALLLADLWPT